MKPHIVLKIEDFTPNIYLRSDEKSRKLTNSNDSIFSNMVHAVKELGIDAELDKNNDVAYQELLTLAQESDEFYMDAFIDLNTEDIEFHLNEFFTKRLADGKNIEEEYQEVKMNEKARREINQNQAKDIFATILDSMYLLLIAKTLVAASELGIDEIHLDDKSKNVRFAERMTKEIDKMGIELVID